MQQDKNFHIRLRAAVEKRLKQHGLISEYGANPHRDGESASKEWAFIESLDEITLEFLQGIKPSSNIKSAS